MKISKVKELVLKNELAIENDSTVEKLNEVLKYCFGENKNSYGRFPIYYKGEKYYEYGHYTELPTIKVSEIIFESFKDQVIELRKQFPNDFDFGGAVNKLLNE